MAGTVDVIAGSAPAPDPTGESTPDRPSSVPVGAIWNDTEHEWQLKPTDQLGRPDGVSRTWRADGSVRAICSFSHGKQIGVAWALHPDGSLFSLGCYADGLARGVHRRYASDDPGGEPLQPCCIPPGAWQLRHDHSRANAVDRRWFDRGGQRLLDSGEPYPDRPPGVWADAGYNENVPAWETALTYNGSGSHGTRRQWSPDGVLRLVEDLVDNKRHGEARAYDETGAPQWEAHYVDGQLSGAFRAWQVAPGHFRDARIYEQVGAFEANQAAGVWRYLDVDGALVGQRDLGLILDPQTIAASPAFANDRRPPAWWRSQARALFDARRIGEGLVATARAAAREGTPAELEQALMDWALPLGTQGALVEARQALERGAENPIALIDALKRGCDASTMFWMLAKAFPEQDRVALDLVSAAVLLDPSSTGALATRALLHGSLGQLEAARADATRVAAQSPDQGEFLQLYLRVYFPRFSFAPVDEQLDIDAADFPIRCQRNVTEVNDVIQRYATRLGHLRAALMSRLNDERDELAPVDSDAAQAAFMVPDLSALLPAGPVALTRHTFQMSLEDYQGQDDGGALAGGGAGAGAEARDRDANGGLEAVAPDRPQPENSASTVDIVVDELRDVLPPPATILAIMRRARADWSGLSWLCWAVGLTAPGLPEELHVSSSFGRAAIMTMERTWRCRDKIRTSGLLAMTKGIAGFDWEGTPIDQLPQALADLPLEEYVEARAVFSWLCDATNRSPWQDDLRGNDD